MTDINLRNTLHKLDKSIANYPYTTLKYLTNNVEVESLGFDDRSDLEYLMLNYDVDKNLETGASAQSIVKMIRERNVFAGFDVKKDGVRLTVIKIVSLILVLVIILVLIAIISIVVLFLCSATYAMKPLKQFLLYTFLLLIILSIVIMFYNKVMQRIAMTSNMIK